MKYLILFLNLLFISGALHSQDFFIPKEFRKALDNGTRSESGYPGKNYWQNSSDYDISVKIDSYSKTLTATADIKYYNNSPSSLNMLVFRTYQDFSKPGKSRDWEISEKDFTDGMNISKLIINNSDIDLQSKSVSRAGTNLTIKLNSPIASGSVTAITIDWSLKIPADFPRMGAYDSTSYMIAYWYPQISVYDDIDGWDMIDYKGQVEFYNDFNNYNVKITTDRNNMCVWATGTLENPSEIFTSDYFSKYNDALSGNSEFVVDCSNTEAPPVIHNNGSVTWNFKASSVPDFAFALSDHYVWKMKGVKLSSGSIVKLSTAFRPKALAFNKFDVFSVAEKYLMYVSDVFPGVPYPYPSMTVFNGEGGMEFPMMVNDDDTESWESTVYLTSHEMAHTYFPFYMGINERKYAWMDEGWAVYLPQNFQTTMNENPPFELKDTNRGDSRAYNVRTFQRSSGTFNDIPMLSPSHQLRSPSYRLNAYSKAAIVYDIMSDMIGERYFRKFMKEYITSWNCKHPSPYDFFNLFNTFTRGNYNWFFKKWFMEFGTADLKLAGYKETADKEYEITVLNTGGMPVPVSVTLFDESNKSYVFGKDASAWKDKSEIKLSVKLNSKLKRIELGNRYIPDINPQDNFIEAK